MKTRPILVLLLAVVALLALTVSANAQAPIYDAQTLTSTAYTNGPQTGTNINVVLDVRKQASVALQLKSTSNGTNVLGQGLWVEWSVDGLTYSGGRLVTLTTAGTTTTTAFTNLNTFGCGYIRIPYATNLNDVSGITNAVLKYGIKISAP